jgi:hypothetical protein
LPPSPPPELPLLELPLDDVEPLDEPPLLLPPLDEPLPELVPPPELDDVPPSAPPLLDPPELPELDPPPLLVDPLLPPELPLEDPAPPWHTGTVVSVFVGAACWHVSPDGHPCEPSQNGVQAPSMQMSFAAHEAVPCVDSQLDPAAPDPALMHA